MPHHITAQSQYNFSNRPAQQQHLNASADGHGDHDHDDTEHIEDWSPEQLHERSKTLQLIDENGSAINGGSSAARQRSAASASSERSARPAAAVATTAERRCDQRLDDVASSELEDETKSASKSTTSDSQVCGFGKRLHLRLRMLSYC